MAKAEKKKESWQECRKTIRCKWHVPFVFVEWICWRVSPFLEQLDLLKVLKHLGHLAILFAVISYIFGGKERRMQAENQLKAKHYQAWQVINSAQGKTGDGGRTDALKDLHSDGVSLGGVDISGAYLPELNLENAVLNDANLSGATLFCANLAGANLTNANLAGANLIQANLSGANLVRANLTGTNLTDANLPGATLFEANLSEARLWRVNLSGAELFRADFSKADLSRVNLSRANLCSSNLKDIQKWQSIKSVELARIRDVNNPPDGFMEWAEKGGAVSIGDYDKWQQLISEKKKQEAEDGRGDQKKAGEK